MSIEQVVQTYGYAALVLGALMEGETILMLAGFAAHRGYLALPVVIIIGSLATIMLDQFLFAMGRYYGQQFLEKRTSWKLRAARLQQLLQKYQNLVIVGFRFMYGMRIVAPFVIGMSTVTARRFVVLNILSAFLWAGIFATGGYFFGTALEVLLGDIKSYEMRIFFGIALTGAVLYIGYCCKRNRAK